MRFIANRQQKGFHLGSVPKGVTSPVCVQNEKRLRGWQFSRVVFRERPNIVWIPIYQDRIKGDHRGQTNQRPPTLILLDILITQSFSIKLSKSNEVYGQCHTMCSRNSISPHDYSDLAGAEWFLLTVFFSSPGYIRPALKQFKTDFDLNLHAPSAFI